MPIVRIVTDGEGEGANWGDFEFLDTPRVGDFLNLTHDGPRCLKVVQVAHWAKGVGGNSIPTISLSTTIVY